METKQEFKHLVRIANADLDGNKQVFSALTMVQGVGFMMSNAVCYTADVDRRSKVGDLSDETISKIEDIIKDPSKYSIPEWLFNRRNDPEDGVSRHIITTNLKFISENDIKLMKKIKCYKGVRHSHGLTVRGQRTRSNFRKNKGKVHLGVKRKEGVKAGRV